MAIKPQAVTDSRNALDAAREFEPDLVITDIQLPHVSGLDLIRLIRKDEQLAAIPIMAVTAYSAHGDEERIRAAGCAGLCVEADFGREVCADRR